MANICYIFEEIAWILYSLYNEQIVFGKVLININWEIIMRTHLKYFVPPLVEKKTYCSPTCVVLCVTL